MLAIPLKKELERGRLARWEDDVCKDAARLRQGYAGLCGLSAEAAAQADAARLRPAFAEAKLRAGRQGFAGHCGSSAEASA